MNNNAGSNWKKWDLHMHSNASDGEATPEEIVDKAIELGISAIALTDHHTVNNIDHIKRIGREKGLTIITGIEFRTEYGKKSVHMIGLLPEKYNGIELNEEAINDLILNQLGLSKTAIRAAARANDPSIKNDETAYKKGLLLCQVEFKKASDLIHKYGGLVSVHAGSKTNSFDEEMRHEGMGSRDTNLADSLGPVKEELLHDYIDICEVRKADESSFYLQNFGKPSIAASDAHELSDIGRNYAWIKAEPTFEGLRQIIFEPETRVKIQKDAPDAKKDYLIIDSLHIEHPDFSVQDIPLNAGLNTIIGGRSSGKSLLLGCIARLCGDPKPIKEGKDEYNRYIENIIRKSHIKWKDGIVDEKRRIDYFPQGYIIDIASKTDRKVELVERILGSSEQYNDLLRKTESFIMSHAGSIHSAYAKLILQQQELKRLKDELSQAGSKLGVENEIKKIDEHISQLLSQMPNQPTEEQEQLHESKKNQIKAIKDSIAGITSQNSYIHSDPVINCFSQFVFPDINEEDPIAIEIKAAFTRIAENAKQEWDAYLVELTERLKKETEQMEQAIGIIESDEEYKRIETLYTQNNELQVAKKLLDDEKNHLDQICQYEKRIHEAEEKIKEQRHSLISMHCEYFFEYERFTQSIEMEKEGIRIIPTIEFNKPLYKQTVETYFDGRTVKNAEILYMHYSDIGSYQNYIQKIVYGLLDNNEYALKGGYSAENALETILSTNYFTISYDIQYQNDSLASMSEGKAAFVILRLLLDFSSSEYPILIDQPEDELDNRAIYTDLVQYIRNKKKERQIILVTHNPNIVVGADAEEIIVANQNDIENKNQNEVKFQYRSGALEESFEGENNIILFKKGIREHVCEILEGGDEAFQKRESRYQIRKI